MRLGMMEHWNVGIMGKKKVKDKLEKLFRPV